MQAITTYFKGVFNEMRSVSWPHQKTVVWFSVAVVLVSFLCGYFMGVFDVIFERLLKVFINLFA